jgi:hypothetical protein
MQYIAPARPKQAAFWRLCTTLAVSLSLALATLSATHVSTAKATWAGHCSSASHCYALTYWCPAAEKNIHHIWTYVTTTNMDVPREGESVDFIDNEMWVAWKCSGGGEWIETGQAAGTPRSGSWELYPFYAKKSSSGYEAYTGYSEVKGGVGNLYQVVRSSEGDWCAEWGYTVERCYEGFASGPARVLEQGVEAATNTEPFNTGYGEGYAEGGNYNLWEGSIKAELETEAGTCASGHSPGSGSLNFGAGSGC